MNKVILCGRFTRDPEIRYSQSENSMAIARFTAAVDRRFKRDNESSADFINCIAFGKTAEFIEKYCRKGIKMVIEGRWQTGSYTNKDGNKVYTNDCVVENIEFAEGKNAGEENQAKPQPKQRTVDDDGFMSIPAGIEEGLPFN